jgi:glutathionylspermidine synthase
MRRVPTVARANWESEVERWGLVFHTFKGQPYWNESSFYELTALDVEQLENAANDLHQLCLAAVEHIVSGPWLGRMGIRESAQPYVREAWLRRFPSLYGRFDFSYGSGGPPKLLEYNADTPTSLLEAAVVQWQWSQSVFPGVDQFNSIWEHLVARWKELAEQGKIDREVHFAHEESVEDLMTVSLLRDSASEAGLETVGLHIGEIGWNGARQRFVDLDDVPIQTLFKLYPWEWLVQEPFAGHALRSMHTHTWLEPIWKMALSNKALLAALWELYPDHPNLLPAYLDGPREMSSYVVKPTLGREGANVRVFEGGTQIEATPGEYGEGAVVYQALARLPDFGGNHPVLGVWMVSGEACGLGIRETDGLITTDLARFVPHVISG